MLDLFAYLLHLGLVVLYPVLQFLDDLLLVLYLGLLLVDDALHLVTIVPALHHCTLQLPDLLLVHLLVTTHILAYAGEVVDYLVALSLLLLQQGHQPHLLPSEPTVLLFQLAYLGTLVGQLDGGLLGDDCVLPLESHHLGLEGGVELFQGLLVGLAVVQVPLELGYLVQVLSY